MTLLIIDIGSSSARALLYDDSALPIPGATVAHRHRFITAPDGTATADPHHLQALTEDCIDELLTHPAARDIRAVGMATFVGNLLGVDAGGVPITPIYTYADTRSHISLPVLRAEVDAAAAHQRTGCGLHTAYHPARLHWLHAAQPRVFASVARWVDLATYLYEQWFGETLCSYSVASWSGLLHRTDLTWDAAWCTYLGIPLENLPSLEDYTTPLTGLRGEYVARWSVLRDVPFFLAVGDGAAANIGAGAVDENHRALTVGTTAAIRVVTPHLRPVPPGLWSYRVDARRHLIGGATSEGGNIYRWLRQTLNLPDDAESQIAERPPGVHGLTFLPLLAGERSPGWNGNARGAVSGLRLDTTPLDLLHAALEGVAHRLALVKAQMGDGALPVYAGGGALRESEVWTQIICDALDSPLYLIGEAEVTARGVALLVLEALGTPADPTPAITTRLTPRRHYADAMRRARAQQVALYEALFTPE